MSIKLSDAQLAMLSAAAQSDDRCLVAPKNLKGGAAQKVAAKLIGAGLAKEIKAKAGMPVWRRDEAAAQSYALKLTAAGAKAIVVDESSASQEASESVSGCNSIVPANVFGVQQTPLDASAVDSAPGPVRQPAAPRSGTKIAQVIALLRRDSGATLDELVAATDWLPHTTRAALTGLRKRGYTVALDRASAGLGSTYRMRTDRAAGGADVASGDDIAGNRDAARDDDPSAMPTASAGTAKDDFASASGRVMANRRQSVGVKQEKPGLASAPPDEAETLDAMISGLADLGVDQLRLQWRNHLGGSAPAHLPRWLLLRVLTYRLQAAALGDLDKATLRLLRLSKDEDVGSHGARPFEIRGPTTRDGIGLKTGALLVREWHGELERVMILDKGFAWRGKSYRSLSQIAKAMTGANWNGHRFFGLRPSGEEGGSSRSAGVAP